MKRSRRAVTLAEMLIAMAGLVIIGGMALGVYENTQSAATKMTRRQGAIDYAVRVMDEISEAVSDALPPENFASAPAPNEFKGPRIAVLTYSGRKAPGLSLVALEAKNGKLSRIERQIEPPAGGARVTGDLDASLAGRFDDVPLFIAFRYAAESKLGQPVVYVNELPAGQWPALVEITLRATLPEDPLRPIELRTAAIPGRIPRRAGTEAAR